MRHHHAVSEEHYQAGRSLYEAGQPLRTVFNAADAFEERMEAEHRAVDEGPADPAINRNEVHNQIDDCYRFAAQSLMIGFAEGVLADIRRASGGRRGQTA